MVEPSVGRLFNPVEGFLKFDVNGCIFVCWVFVLLQGAVFDVPALRDAHVHILLDRRLGKGLGEVYLGGMPFMTMRQCKKQAD